MKQAIFYVFITFFVVSCGGTTQLSKTETVDTANRVTINLVEVIDDKITVEFNPGKFTEKTVSFYFPKTVPGTYSTDNYGRLIEQFKAFDYNGNELDVNKTDDNTWLISRANELDKIEYKVNDTFDVEDEFGIFSPAGTNIEAGENFLLNLHGVIGYFANKQELPYQVTIHRPEQFHVSTALTVSTKLAEQEDYAIDHFVANRYFQIIDNPLLYSKSAPANFIIDDMKVVLDVYSPTELFSAEMLQPNIEKMMAAQKNYLGAINNTPLYAILLYLSKSNIPDAAGFGALEHHTSTVVVFPELMPKEYLNEMMTDVVSHEFFHTLTPLNIHSKEIHYFDYNDPKMSQHLWLYEGVTEYFANHFQIHEKLIDEQSFYKRLQDKVNNANRYTDTMPFTEMSKNILVEPYKDEYLNVYEKGALIGMALDIRLRELSNGKTGLLHLMGKLSEKFGSDKPFDDDELIPTIVSLTYPEIQNFFDLYVTGSTPIPYDEFYAKVGLAKQAEERETNMLIMDFEIPFIDLNESTKEIYFGEGLPSNSMIMKLGIKPGDILQSVNGKEYDLDNLRDLILSSMQWKEGDELTMMVLRDSQPVTLNAVYETPMYTQKVLRKMDLPDSDPRVKLRNNWLYN